VGVCAAQCVDVMSWAAAVGCRVVQRLV